MMQINILIYDSASALRQLCVSAVLVLLTAWGAAGAGLRDAERAFLDGNYDKSRKIYEKVLKRAKGGEEQSARLGIAWTYMYEKDYASAVSTLARQENRYPNNTRGDWMRLLMYTSGRALASGGDASGRSRAISTYHSLVRYPPDFSVDNLELWLDLNKKLNFFERPSVDDESAPGDRAERYRVIETLAGLDIHDAAIRMLHMLVVEKHLDRVARASLFLQGRESLQLGDVDEAKKLLTVFVFLFPKDPKSAMALGQLARIADRAGSPEDARRYRAALAAHFPDSLHGIEAAMLLGWRSNDARRPGPVARSVMSMPGLPPALAERGLALAVAGPAGQMTEAERYEAVDRYAKAFPLSPLAAEARRWVDGRRPPDSVKMKPSVGSVQAPSIEQRAAQSPPAKVAPKKSGSKKESAARPKRRPWWKFGGGGVWKPDRPAIAAPASDTPPAQDTAPPVPPKPEPLKPTVTASDTPVPAKPEADKTADRQKKKKRKPLIKKGVWFRSTPARSEEADSKQPAPGDTGPLKRERVDDKVE